jgi:hypothetical protein
MERIREKEKNEFARRVRDFTVGVILDGIAIWIVNSGVIANLLRGAYNALSSLPQNATIAVEYGGVPAGAIEVLNTFPPFLKPLIVAGTAATSLIVGTYLIGRSLEE